jgi:hypothetical protein
MAAPILVSDLQPTLCNPEVHATIEEMLDEELATAINSDYMDFHSEAIMSDNLWITPAMRLMTVNWMSEAVHDLNLDQVGLIM